MSIEQMLLEAMERNVSVSLDTLGGEDALVAEGLSLARSDFAPEFIVLGLQSWASLQHAEFWVELIVTVLEENSDRLAVGTIVSALASAQLPDYGTYVRALEIRVRERKSSDLLKLEAAAGIVRLTILDKRWSANAIVAVGQIRSVTDPIAAGKMARLASITFELFQAEQALTWLDDAANHTAGRADAAFELGMVRLSQALEQKTVEGIVSGLRSSKNCFQASIDSDEDRRDSKIYCLLTDALIGLADPQSDLPTDTAEKLRIEALVSFMWDRPIPGYEWLSPPPTAHLNWIPVVDGLCEVARHMARPSWLEAASILSRVVTLYRSERAIRPGMSNIGALVRPAIEARFLMEAGLLRHLDDWLEHAKATNLNASDAQILRKNIDIRKREISLGKAQGSANSRSRSYKH